MVVPEAEMKAASDVSNMASALTAEAVMLLAYLSERLSTGQKRDKIVGTTKKVTDNPEVQKLVCEALLTQMSRWLLST